jgi:flavin reductase (DIM6/NTAB) family NADH-FMN oxidoreductase RutF
MKPIVKTALFALTGLTAAAALSLSGCTSGKSAGENSADAGKAASQTLTREEIKARPFADLFKAVDVKEIPEDVFTLISKDFAVLTAGNPSRYNSMVAGWGGWGVMFSKPTTFLMLRSSRYTLELMRTERRYTMAFFDDEFKDDIMKFGAQSGRDSDEKMKNTALTAVETPANNMAFKEAKLIIECNLVQVTTVAPDDFYTDESKKFIVDAYAETKDYHKVVFGEITNVWVRK